MLTDNQIKLIKALINRVNERFSISQFSLNASPCNLNDSTRSQAVSPPKVTPPDITQNPSEQMIKK